MRKNRKARARGGFTGVERVIVIAITLLLGVILFTVGKTMVDKANETQGYSVLRLANIAATNAYLELGGTDAFRSEKGVVLAYPVWYDAAAAPPVMMDFARRFENYIGDDDVAQKLTLTLTGTASPDSPDIQIRYYPNGRGNGAYLLYRGGRITGFDGGESAPADPESQPAFKPESEALQDILNGSR